MTAIDRFTRWPIAVPIKDTSAENVAKVFLHHWICNFGVPSTVTTDRGSQFQSTLFREFSNLLGCHHISTTAYHPSSNGLVERFHRPLKAALMCHRDPNNWSDQLPLILLSLRTVIKEDIQCSAADLVYGSTLRLPGELVVPSKPNDVQCSFVQKLKELMNNTTPTPTRPTQLRTYIPGDLKSCTFVLVRHDAVRKPLQPPYDGPFKVLERNEKYFTIDKNGRSDTVSIDRLKPAYFESMPSTTSHVPPAIPTNSPAHVVSIPVNPTPLVTSRSGRAIILPTRLADYGK